MLCFRINALFLLFRELRVCAAHNGNNALHSVAVSTPRSGENNHTVKYTIRESITQAGSCAMR